ncbi:hypothetical protein [Pseudofrankia inefficax]|uniref:Uncharacterized protein n=1 Tax=Pseudofrankia inefficax (strain DSM 45817 / CECT 9037 / DDB 130130 / EuI1c) TaxID=298654 RepID=E3JD28_PSEI1|nr:hypothetical protein [Pseudofrankia inefficax]ADP81167.1 hypothetical protein FraEuI1c_3148 [Pseudofrankia inefficax]
MRYSTYAHVVSPDDFRGGVGGLLLRDVLDENDGRYEHLLRLSERARKDLRELARLTGNGELARIADADATVVSLEHLRHLDPDTTRIRIGSEVTREPGDGPLPGFDR